MSESTQKKLDRVRPPRVQITYDVESGGAVESKELPFVVGVMADLSGTPETPLPKLKDRKFVEIDASNFDTVLASTKPRLALQVPNVLQNDDSALNILLNFRSMDDFNPTGLIRQIGPLAKLYEARGRLSDLLAKLDGNDELEQLLAEVIGNAEAQAALKTQLAANGNNPE